MKFGSLFTGIGGLDLGLERAGMTCEWQVEIDDYATRVLEKHWPNVRRFRDVRECGAHNLGAVELIAGGFPCQDVSSAGLRIGIAGPRSGLWKDYARIIREIRPKYVLVENVPGLRSRGMGEVLGDLANLGFDAVWGSLSACAFGFPHMRERVFILAHPSRKLAKERFRIRPILPEEIQAGRDFTARIKVLEAEQRDYGGLNGVPARVDYAYRLFGNSVMPQIAEWIGKRIMETFKVLEGKGRSG